MLAGGAATRLGGAKSGAPLGRRPLISYPLAAARAAELEPVVVAKRDSPLPPLDCPLVVEPDQPLHPLCGIVAAMRHAREEPVVVVGCDMPFVTPALLAWLGYEEQQADRVRRRKEVTPSTPRGGGVGECALGAAVASIGGTIQPLLARYAPAQLPVLERALGRQEPLRKTVEGLRPTVLDEPELSRFGDPQTLCFNVNDQSGLAFAEALLAERESSLTVSSSASDTATSSAESASAPEKSVAKRP